MTVSEEEEEEEELPIDALRAARHATEARLYQLQGALCALDALTPAAATALGGASDAPAPAAADAPPAVAPQAGGASTARPNRVPAADERAFSSLDEVLIVVPGLFHLCKQGLLKAVWKIYWYTLLAPLLLVWPNRSRVTVKCEHFERCREMLYHAQRALWLGYLAKFDETRPPTTPGADPCAQRDAYARDFIVWLRAQMAIDDEVFRHYAGFVLGPGLLFREMESALRLHDVQFAIALLLPVLGLYKLTSKHNLAKQTFFFLLQLMTVEEVTAQRIMANLCRWESERRAHGIPTDEVLERRVGWIKAQLGHVRARARAQPPPCPTPRAHAARLRCPSGPQRAHLTRAADAPRASRARAQDFTWEQLVAISGTIDYWRRVWSGLDASLGPPTDDDAAARGKKTGAAHRDIETATARLLRAGVCAGVAGRKFDSWRSEPHALADRSARLQSSLLGVLLNPFERMVTTEQTLLQVAADYFASGLRAFCDVEPGDASYQDRSTRRADEAESSDDDDDDDDSTENRCAICEDVVPADASAAAWATARCGCTLCPEHLMHRADGCPACRASRAADDDASSEGDDYRAAISDDDDDV
jgi:hypothetical protein